MKIKEYMMWCEDNGHVNEHGEADSMEYAVEYMKGRDYAKEHDNQSLMNSSQNSLLLQLPRLLLNQVHQTTIPLHVLTLRIVFSWVWNPFAKFFQQLF